MVSPHVPPAPFFIGEQIIVPKDIPLWVGQWGPRAIVGWEQQHRRHQAGILVSPAPNARLPNKYTKRRYKVYVQEMWAPSYDRRWIAEMRTLPQDDYWVRWAKDQWTRAKYLEPIPTDMELLAAVGRKRGKR